MMDRRLKMATADASAQQPQQQRDGEKPISRHGPSTTKVALAAPNVNATAIFKAGMLDLEKRVNAAGDGNSCVTCFGRAQSSASSSAVVGGRKLRPSSLAPHAMEGKKILRALSAFACMSLRASTKSSPSASLGFPQSTTVPPRASSADEQKASQADQRILLRIVMWGGPNTLLLLAPFDAPAECVIEMVLDSYVNGLQECDDFELFCAHCNSPALHPKQRIGAVGSRHFLLCKKGPQISGFSFFNSHSQFSLSSQQSSHSSKHSHSSHAYSSHSHGPQSIRHRRSLSQGSFSFLQSSLVHSYHKRSNSWWNPVQCLH